MDIGFAKGTCGINTHCCIVIYVCYIFYVIQTYHLLILLAPKVFMTCDMTIDIVNLLHFP